MPASNKMEIVNKIKQNSFSIFFSALAGACLLLPKLVLADTPATTDTALTNCHNFKSQFYGAFDWVPDKYCTASGLAIFVIQTIISFSGVVAVLFLIVGGFFYLTSAGNEEQAEKGQKILTNAIIGLVVIVLAYALVAIIGSVVTAGQ
jgi:hypothetical protein